MAKMLGYGAFNLTGTRQHRSVRLTQPTWLRIAPMAFYLYRVAGETRSASVGDPEPSGAGDFAVVLTLDPSDPKERRIYGLSPEDALENALTVVAGLADRGEVWPKP